VSEIFSFAYSKASRAGSSQWAKNDFIIAEADVIFFSRRHEDLLLILFRRLLISRNDENLFFITYLSIADAEGMDHFCALRKEEKKIS
jgi:hypothetical protein